MVEQQVISANTGQPAADLTSTGDAAAPRPETWVVKKRSYCETCDTAKKSVQWWSVPFKTPARPQQAVHDVYSACGACKRYVPKALRDMPLDSW